MTSFEEISQAFPANVSEEERPAYVAYKAAELAELSQIFVEALTDKNTSDEEKHKIVYEFPALLLIGAGQISLSLGMSKDDLYGIAQQLINEAKESLLSFDEYND